MCLSISSQDNGNPASVNSGEGGLCFWAAKRTTISDNSMFLKGSGQLRWGR